RTPAGNRAGSRVVARMTPTSASGAAFTGRAGQTRPPTWSRGSWERTAATRTGRSAANPSSRSARALAAWSASALITSSTRAGSAMVVRAGPERSRTAGGGGRAKGEVTQGGGGAGAFQPYRADLFLVEGDRHRGGGGWRRGGRLAAVGRAADRPPGAGEPDPRHALRP